MACGGRACRTLLEPERGGGGLAGDPAGSVEQAIADLWEGHRPVFNAQCCVCADCSMICVVQHSCRRDFCRRACRFPTPTGSSRTELRIPSPLAWMQLLVWSVPRCWLQWRARTFSMRRLVPTASDENAYSCLDLSCWHPAVCGCDVTLNFQCLLWLRVRRYISHFGYQSVLLATVDAA